MFDSRDPSSLDAFSGEPGEARPERIMKITPLDLRQQRFRRTFRGYDCTEVVAFLTETADDYEQALREIDLLRQDLSRIEALLTEHRQREENLRNTLLTAQRLADDLKENAQNEAKLIVREAEGRAGLLLEKAAGRLEEIDRDINEMRLRRRSVEGSLEASIQALRQALEFIREQGQSEHDEKILLHRPRQGEVTTAATQQAATEASPTEHRTTGQT